MKWRLTKATEGTVSAKNNFDWLFYIELRKRLGCGVRLCRSNVSPLSVTRKGRESDGGSEGESVRDGGVHVAVFRVGSARVSPATRDSRGWFVFSDHEPRFISNCGSVGSRVPPCSLFPHLDFLVSMHRMMLF